MPGSNNLAMPAADLADHSKIGVVSRSVFCETDKMVHLITDAKARQKPGFGALAAAVPGLVAAGE